jgi:hypothetical protein
MPNSRRAGGQADRPDGKLAAVGHVPLTLPQLVLVRHDEPRPTVRHLLEQTMVAVARAEVNGNPDGTPPW